MKTNMSNEQIAKILAGEHLNYVCRMAGRIFPNRDRHMAAHTESYLARIESAKAAIASMTREAFNAANNSQIPTTVWAEMGGAL